jgi:nucleoside-diphosphate-sugar epimerase
MSKKALVTGANGFVGTNLVQALLAKGYEVSCLVRKTSNRQSIKDLPVKFSYGECCDIDSLRNSCVYHDYLFHLAAKVKAKSRKEYFQVNLEGTKNVLEIANELKVKKFVFLSSQAAAGPSDSKRPKVENEKENPISYYGKSKLAAEKHIIQNAKVPWTIIRPASLFGPWDRDFLIYFKLAKRHIAPLAGFGEKYISLLYVKDLADLIIKAAESKLSDSQVFFASDGMIYKWQDFIDTLADVMQKKVITVKLPMVCAYTLAGFNELTKIFRKSQSTINWQKVKEMREPYWLCSSQKAMDILGFSPGYPLRQALQLTYQWYIDNKWL